MGLRLASHPIDLQVIYPLTRAIFMFSLVLASALQEKHLKRGIFNGTGLPQKGQRVSLETRDLIDANNPSGSLDQHDPVQYFAHFSPFSLIQEGTVIRNSATTAGGLLGPSGMPATSHKLVAEAIPSFSTQLTGALPSSDLQINKAEHDAPSFGVIAESMEPDGATWDGDELPTSSDIGELTSIRKGAS
ncbi:hypothetical protein cyc_00779 [Cyclospora cayetanensis]|uniref:Uncharacterized protein n=1 Tax=Cyclospora cayetanensis TaxID=88456 RepID=A0A1D3CV39_9EIME|nr:hypothetical protein cyc_00779 [Cyclospora cayetanensis]